MEIFALAIWCIFWGVICAVLAERKGRGPIIWFVMGFLFSFLAMILLFVMSDITNNVTEESWVDTRTAERKKEKEDKRRSAEISTVSVSDTRDCPYCAETIKKAAIICRFCGRDIPAITEKAFSPPATPIVKPLLLPYDHIECLRCGSQQRSDRIICKDCGAAFTQ